MLSADELEAFGEVRGLRMLQLASAAGDEALNLALLGAEVTAVDLAASHLETGRMKAAALGVDVCFVEGDMTALAPDLTDFDWVLISWGGICWVPDITAWAGMVAERLVPGGVLVVSEHHPLWEVLSVRSGGRGEGELVVSGDYFRPEREGYADPAKAPQVTRAVGVPDAMPHSYVWGIGAVISALLAAGLELLSLVESPEPELYPGLGDAARRIPATYTLSARRWR